MEEYEANQLEISTSTISRNKLSHLKYGQPSENASSSRLFEPAVPGKSYEGFIYIHQLGYATNTHAMVNVDNLCLVYGGGAFLLGTLLEQSCLFILIPSN